MMAFASPSGPRLNPLHACFLAILARNERHGRCHFRHGTCPHRQEELLALARSPKALRQAILLREILGPPRSLQTDFAAPNLAPL